MPLNQLVPQISRIAQTMIHGISEAHTSPCDGLCSGLAGAAVAADSSFPRNAGDVQIFSGCQTLRKRIRQAMEISDAPMSTIHGLTKLEIRNCGTAKDTPVTRIAGQISFIPLKPAKAQISQNGTISEKNGSCRPTMAPSRNGSRPVTLARPAIGVPSAP